MNCKKCQAEIPEGAKFCVSCGEPAVQDNNQTAAPASMDVAADGVKAAEAVETAAEAASVEAAPEEAPVEGAEATPAAVPVEEAPAAEPVEEASAAAAAAEPVEEAPAEAAPAAEQPVEEASAEAAPAAEQPVEEASTEAAPVEAQPAVAAPAAASPSEAAPAAAEAPVTPTAAPEAAAAPQPAYSPAVPAGPEGGSGNGSGKNFTKVIIGVIAAIVVISVAALAAIKLTAKDPKEVVIAAFESIHPEDEVNPGEELFGTSEFLENVQKASSEGGLTLKLSGSSDPTISQFNGSGIRIEGKENKETKESSANIGVIYNDMDLLNLNAYYGNDKAVVEVPELTTKALTLDLSKDMAQQVKDSPTFGPMADEMGINVEGFAAYFDELQKQADKEEQPFDLAALMNRYKEGCKAEENFKAALTVTKGEKKNFTMDGSEVSCRGYETVVSKASMIDFLNSSSDFFLQDEQLRQDFLNQLQMTVRMSELMGETMGATSAEDLTKQTYDEVERTVEEMVTYLDESLDDVNMTVYVDKKGRLAAVEGTTVLHVDDEDLDVEFTMELKGGAYLTQNFDGTVKVTDGTDTVSADIHRAGEYDGNKLTDDMNIELAITGEGEYGFTYTTTYTKDSGDYHVGMNLYGEGSEIVDISLTGVIDELEKGKTFHTDIDELKITLMDKSEYVSLEGEYYYRPLEGSIATPQGETMDVMAATYDDWNDVVMEVYGNVFGLLMQLQ